MLDSSWYDGAGVGDALAVGASLSLGPPPAAVGLDALGATDAPMLGAHAARNAATDAIAAPAMNRRRLIWALSRSC